MLWLRSGSKNCFDLFSIERVQTKELLRVSLLSSLLSFILSSGLSSMSSSITALSSTAFNGVRIFRTRFAVTLSPEIQERSVATERSCTRITPNCGRR